eukprot:scaffold33459_cov37-Prasinocladus_malaysianus.AAC.2
MADHSNGIVCETQVVVATGYSNETNISSIDTDVSIEVQGSLRTSTFSLEPATDEIAFDVGGSLLSSVSVHK